MIIVLVLFVIARILGGRPAGHLSKRQRRRAAERSAEDLRRCELRHRMSDHRANELGVNEHIEVHP